MNGSENMTVEQRSEWNDSSIAHLHIYFVIILNWSNKQNKLNKGYHRFQTQSLNWKQMGPKL